MQQTTPSVSCSAGSYSVNLQHLCLPNGKLQKYANKYNNTVVILISFFNNNCWYHACLCRLLLTFANSLNPDQVSWIKTDTLMINVFLKEFLKKKMFSKIQQTTKRHAKKSLNSSANTCFVCIDA